jgi:RNA polymerase sigma factor for flagellar operon FliA
VLERQELRKLLIATIAGMPRAQRMVLRAHYFEDLPFKEIAKILGVSLSRVFQLKAQGIVWLQNQLRNDWPAQGSGWTPARS